MDELLGLLPLGESIPLRLGPGADVEKIGQLQLAPLDACQSFARVGVAIQCSLDLRHPAIGRFHMRGALEQSRPYPGLKQSQQGA